MCCNTNNMDTNEGVCGGVKKYLLQFLRCVVVQIHCLFDYAIDLFFEFYYNKNKVKRVSPIKNQLLLESGISLAQKIRNGNLTSEEVVKAFIERCKEVNTIINAVANERFQDAIGEAKKVDEFLKDENVDREMLKEKKPFLGVPFTMKESNTVKGMPHTMGILARKDHIATEDAEVVANLKEAGGILIATTNIPEMCSWIESRNKVYGQTNNPYNSTRTAGGSGGGDGALLGASGTPIAIGTDLGGSIRIPAFSNGIFGLKPSGGATSIKGVNMIEEDYEDTIIEAGPMCKKAEDLLPLLKVISGRKLVNFKKLDSHVDVKKLNIFYQLSSEDLITSKVSKIIKSSLMKAVNHLKEVTGSATEIKMPGSEKSLEIFRHWKTRDLKDFCYDLTNRQGRVNIGKEFLNILTGRGKVTLGTMILLIDTYVTPPENEEYVKELTTILLNFLTEKLGDNGVLLYPTLPTRVLHHNESFFKLFNFLYLGLFNALKLPACNVPLGLDKDGLPIGIQIIAGPKNDHLCIAVAKELETAFGGYVPPS
ncbi:fatty-acid amide hydrolase 2-like isoform X2 [Leptopilina boulardi]|uniref:fatty-acid amide hydrolase 2-like isoform X2 n=1 Tax=Leptopilina boulardi TaxID=63433 RepID=UPI0021F64A54|nr:fatty-acid amide hydrolase 2-like isoform X2 [Leptopilina boulardi]